MINAFYTSKAGAIGFQKSLDITANNIANVNTQGFKAQNPTFAELLYSDIGDGANGLSVGSGSRMETSSRPNQNGVYITTGRNTDVYLFGKGYFAVEQPDGSIAYTRSGSFTLSQEDGENYLTSTDGSYVLDEGLQRIAVNGGGISLSTPSDGGGTVLGVFSFANPGAMVAQGDGKYIPSDISGQAVPDNATSFGNGAIEGSDVDIAIEMTRMIMSQRGFQLNARMLQTADEIEQVTNSLRG